MAVVVLVVVLLAAAHAANGLNLAPVFEADMNQHTLKENTPIGTVVYTLKGSDPEGSRVRFGLRGTDLLSVDPISGAVRVERQIDRESRQSVSGNEIRLTVSIEDEPGEGDTPPNVVAVPVSVIILDENDNAPEFRGAPYKATVAEDTPVGSTLFQAIEVTDEDLVGEVLDVQCVPREGYDADACDTFAIYPRRQETDHDMFRGSVVLKKPLDYRTKQIYRLPLAVNDGVFTVTEEIVFTVVDVQNSPPVFTGSLTGVVREDDPVGSSVLTVKARDGDSGKARKVVYKLVENPNGYFAVDPASGDITIDRPIDRETLGASSGGVLTLKVLASELINGVPARNEDATSMADVTITIRDVNDSPPAFNKDEYRVSLPENVPFGTPLANLNMEVKDPDTGPHSLFDVSLVGDTMGKFAVEPSRASGHTAVTLKVNSQKLDYENPNERKFLLLVVARESNTEQQLSSTATVTVEVMDLNDNSPAFARESYTALVSESAPQGFVVITITAEDRDSGDYGTAGIRYKLAGTGSELFNVDPISGRITVASCLESCLDYETTQAYFLSYSATDNNGEGKRTVVNLRVSVADANDNPPAFAQKNYRASIDEGEQLFEPRLFLKAKDLDESSLLKYNIVEGNINNLFALNRLSGEVTVRQRGGLRLDNIPTDMIRLSVQVSDGQNTDNALVEIAIKDVNDRSPVFEKQTYLSSVPENAPIGSPIEDVQATDADYGVNAQIAYRIAKGAYDDFVIDTGTGKISLSGNLDYDRRDSYSIEVIAVDGGVPALSGTATLTVSIMNKNNKAPYFSPATQRTQITEDTPVGSLVLTLNASDPDVTSDDGLAYAIVEPITAVDRDGKRVRDDVDDRFKTFFSVNATTGQVFVTEDLDRSLASSVTMRVRITDLSAVPPQEGFGNLVVTIVDVNDFPPAFLEPWSPERPFISIDILEEQPLGTVVHTFTATDADSNIERFKLVNHKGPFSVDASTGNLVVEDRIDYEALEQKRMTFDLKVYDAGVPQKSASAVVIVNIANLNDESPVFDNSSYSLVVMENAPVGTPLLTVNAVDLDEDDFGRVSYSLAASPQPQAFAIGPEDGTIVVVNSDLLDREVTPSMTIQVVAYDSAPSGSRRSASVPVNVKIGDVNDNAPSFVQRIYTATIVDNIPFYPDPSPIVQLAATDADEGVNAELFYAIVAGNENGQFFVDTSTGIVFPNASFVGQNGATYELTVQVFDEGGRRQAWQNPDRVTVTISVENVNTHQPEWFPDPPPNETIQLLEEEDSDVGNVVLKVNARDRDVGGDNQRISYYFKVNNANVAETEAFSMDEETGEVRSKVTFDREHKEKYELVLVARDHGTPVAFETLRFVTVLIKDVNDNDPEFPQGLEDVRFTVPEEEDPGYFVGRVEATDLDEGKNGRVYYYIVAGNEGRWFSVDKTYGNIYTKKRLDREERDHYVIQVKTSNNPDYVCDGDTCDIEAAADATLDRSVVVVHIFVEDTNDNLPRFEMAEYFVGIPFDAKVGDLILDAQAFDPDEASPEDEANGNKLSYSIRTSDLYRSGSTQSSGSLVPSPFGMEANGRLVLASLMTEFTQDRFVIDIEAKESSTQHKARATVNVWVYEPDQLIKFVVAMPPMEVNRAKRDIVAALQNVTQQIVVLDDIRYHIDKEEGLRRDMTDMYVHVVDSETNLITDPKEVLQVVDANYDHLSVVYERVGVQSIVPVAMEDVDAAGFGEKIDPNLAALIALLLVLFLGVILFSILCCCIRNWALASAAAKASKPQRLPPESPRMSRPMSAMGGGIYNSPTSLMDSPDGGPVSGTDNPLWIDQKYKAYEEQELTMTVFSDQDNSVISGQTPQHHASNGSRPGSISRASHLGNVETQSNAYATINKLPLVAAAGRRRSLLGLVNGGEGSVAPERDYATLEKMSPRSPPGPLVPGVHSSTPLGGGVSRRFSNDFGSAGRQTSRSNLIINQNGEPELVADLM